MAARALLRGNLNFARVHPSNEHAYGVVIFVRGIYRARCRDSGEEEDATRVKQDTLTPR